MPSAATGRPLLYCLHALGSSAHEFEGLRARLDDAFELIPIDLPGFGGAPARDTDVDGMVRMLLRTIQRRPGERFGLIGHSMGGKIATIAASRILSGSEQVFGLTAVVLLAASPVVPEPMEEERRQRMLGWVADGPIGEDDAAEFVEANTADDLDDTTRRRAIDDVRASDPRAWTAWLRRGSLEDWSALVSPLDVSALILAGGEDGDLGESAQRELNAPRYPRSEVAVVAGAAHLLPLEAPDEVARRIRDFWAAEVGSAPVVPRDFAAVLASDRTSTQVRRTLATRALPDDSRYAPSALSPAQFATLRTLADTVVPQEGPAIDLAARVDAQLASGDGDGWRPAILPPDLEAYRAGLDALGGLAALSPDTRLDALRAVIAGEGAGRAGGAQPSALDDDQLQAWFEDCRVDLVRHWMAHPATMAALDYDGAANGGDGERFQGFQLLAAGSREAWEPHPPTDTRTTTTTLAATEEGDAA